MDRIAQIKEYLAANPADSFLKHALALELIKRGQEAEAKAQFEELLVENEQYVGSYYHLAKLLERSGEREEALSVYRKGMQVARSLNDRHALNELQLAYEELVDE